MRGARQLNLHGLGLHMLSDACESAGALISTLVMRWKAWAWADVFISIAIGWYIVASVAGLLHKTTTILLHAAPHQQKVALAKCLQQVLLVDRIVAHEDARFWNTAPGTVVGSMRLRVQPDSDESMVQAAVGEVFCGVVHHLPLQIEAPATSISADTLGVPSPITQCRGRTREMGGDAA